MRIFKKLLTSIVLIGVLFGLFLNSCLHNNDAEEPFLFEPYKDDGSNKIALENKSSTAKGTSALVEIAALNTEPVCAQIPTLDEVKLGPWIFTDKFYTMQQAYKLGIPIANLDFTKNITVYVRDYMRAKSCTSSDGTVTLKYGQVIRTVIEIENLDMSNGVDLASLAASATIKKQRQSVYIYKDGFFNNKIDGVISSVSGLVFDVQNYALYQQVMTKMIALLAEPETTFSVNKVGIEADLTDFEFVKEAPIVTYTLSRITRGKSCVDIKKSFQDNPREVEIVERTFNALQMKCDDSKPTDEDKLKARKFLQGIRVK